ncbi:MAG: hypothetical protein D6754_03230 [Alphaproteobacteria bacterium]|nr:MAG: hypothetical protein D6754_03230 [Alphaproteobacteria bacterium]
MSSSRFNLVFIAQSGRLQAEAVLLMASLEAAEPERSYRVIVAEPEAGPLWPGDPGIDDPEIRAFLARAGAETLRFPSRVFGAAYPYGNKIEVLAHLPEGEPFLFLDTDTLILGPLSEVPFDFDRPAASLRRSDTWPKPRPGGPDRAAIWGALYRRFGLDFAASLDRTRPEEDWQRYLYFNAGFFYGRCPREFGALFLQFARAIRDDPPPELAGQKLDPWLDQVALPLVIHALGGGRDALEPGWLDGRTTLHYRALPLLYARESDEVVARLESLTAPNRVKKLLKRYRPFHRLIYRGDGARIRALFDRDSLPAEERVIRRRIRAAGLWLR